MLALPARIDLISVPVSTSPASNVSSIVNSCRAFRLRATVESSRMDGSCGAVREGYSANARTPVLFGPAFELLTHPQGVRLDGHLLRGGAATRTVDHCTSPPFVPRNRTRWLTPAQGPPATGRRSGAGRSPGAPRWRCR